MRRVLALAAAMLLLPGPLAGQAAEHPVQLATATGVIHGTLLLPESGGPHPVALLIAGSGPTDRNGNTVGMGPNDGLKMLAEGLATRGIASVRYDKRGIAASAVAEMSEADLRFTHYIDDAAAWVAQLRADPRFSWVAVVGHSEGSLIGMVAARTAGADRFVSIAGAGLPAGQVLRQQLRPRLPAELYAQAESVLASLEAGQTRDDAPPALAMLFRPNVQPYLISWLGQDPAEEIARLTIPTLIVQGTTDIQVSVAQASALSRARPDARLLVLEGMNHVLKAVPADQAQQVASYTDPSLPLAPGLVDEIAAFLR